MTRRFFLIPLPTLPFTSFSLFNWCSDRNGVSSLCFLNQWYQKSSPVKVILWLHLCLNQFVWNKHVTCELRGPHEELELGTPNRAPSTLQWVGERARLFLCSVVRFEIDRVHNNNNNNNKQYYNKHINLY